MSSTSSSIYILEEEALSRGTSPELYLSYGMVVSRGTRPALSNAVVAAPSFTLMSPPMGLDLFALLELDGRHLGLGGAEAECLTALLHDAIAEHINEELFCESPRFRDGTHDVVGWWTAVLREAFRIVHDEWVAAVGGQGEPGGDAPAAATTSIIVALVLENYVVIANSGASMAVLCRGGGELVELKTTGASWSSSASASAGVDVMAVERKAAQDEFLILASSGLWDKVTPASACAHVRRRLGKTSRITMPWEPRTDAEGSPVILADELAKKALHAGCQDSVSVGLVLFRDFWVVGGSAAPADIVHDSDGAAKESVKMAGASTGPEAADQQQPKRAMKPSPKYVGPDWRAK